MLTELQVKAYNDLISVFWSSKDGWFKYSEKENVSSSSITAVCLMALNGYGDEGKVWVDKNKDILRNYFKSIYPWTDAGKHYKNCMAMAFGIIGMNEINCTKDNEFVEAIDYLISAQNDNGGWGFLKDDTEKQVTHPYFAYWATRALLTKEPSAELWNSSIKKSYYYFCEAAKSYSNYPTSYCMIRHILSLLNAIYEDYLIDEDKAIYSAIHDYKIERHQLKSGLWKSEPEVVSQAYFAKSLFSLKNLYFLASTDYKVISNFNQRMLQWVDESYLSPGWFTDSNISNEGVSWATAYVLMGLNEYRDALKRLVQG